MLCLVQGFHNKNGIENNKTKETGAKMPDLSGSPMLMVVGPGTNTTNGSGSPIRNNNNSSKRPNGNLGLASIPSDSNLSIPTVTISNQTFPGAIPVEPVNNRQSLKHLSVSAPAMRSGSNRNSTDGESPLAPTSSKSRQKKFHRHFKTVPPEEKVLDYYACALVGDILLQGYLYITENNFAFYSNVFGYVTKVLIPVCTVVHITKEKTAKLFPNAVGVRTHSEKHVFASLLSRETTYKLMHKVWNYSNETESENLILKSIEAEKSEDTNSADLPNPDESSGESGSGNDSAIEHPWSPLNSPVVEKILYPKGTSNSVNGSTGPAAQVPVTLLPASAVNAAPVPGGTAPYPRTSVHRSSVIAATTAPNLSTFPGDSRPIRNATLTPAAVVKSRGPSLLVLATALLVILFISATLLLSRISNLQQKLSERPILRDSEQFYQELLTWQNKLHTTSAEEVHQYINSNLEQIIKVRESLEALSLLFTNRPEATLLRKTRGNEETTVRDS